MLGNTVSAADSSWSDKATTVSIRDYLDLVIATNFKNLNPTEPVEVSFVPGSSPQDSLLFLVRPVVTPDVDLTDISDEKKTIIQNFRNNVNKQADAYLASSRILFSKKSVAKNWSGATAENNVAIRFVKSDNLKQTVAITKGGKTSFDQAEIQSASKSVKERAGDLWLD